MIDDVLCLEPGCNQPRYKTELRAYKYCRAHFIARAQAGKRTRKTEVVCSLCHRNPQQASVAAERGIICTGCNPTPVTRQMDYLQVQLRQEREKSAPPVVIPDAVVNTPPVTAKIIATCYGANEELMLLEAHTVERLPMPETERERKEIIAGYARQGYLVAE